MILICKKNYTQEREGREVSSRPGTASPHKRSLIIITIAIIIIVIIVIIIINIITIIIIINIIIINIVIINIVIVIVIVIIIIIIIIIIILTRSSSSGSPDSQKNGWSFIVTALNINIRPKNQYQERK